MGHSVLWPIFVTSKWKIMVHVLRVDKGKGIPITGHESPRGKWMQRVHTAREVKWLILRRPPLSPEKAPDTHFIGGWVAPSTSLDMKEWRKIYTPLTPGSNPGYLARSQASCHWSYLAHKHPQMKQIGNIVVNMGPGYYVIYHFTCVKIRTVFSSRPICYLSDALYLLVVFSWVHSALTHV